MLGLDELQKGYDIEAQRQKFVLREILVRTWPANKIVSLPLEILLQTFRYLLRNGSEPEVVSTWILAHNSRAYIYVFRLCNKKQILSVPLLRQRSLYTTIIRPTLYLYNS